jgi:hypothetical protein
MLNASEASMVRLDYCGEMDASALPQHDDAHYSVRHFKVTHLFKSLI